MDEPIKALSQSLQDDFPPGASRSVDSFEPDPQRPAVVRPVAYRGRMANDGQRHAGYEPEINAWRDWRCERDDDGRFVGKALTIPLDILNASGHPQTRASALIFRLRIRHGVDTGEARQGGFLGLQPKDFPKRLTEIRTKVCIPCSSDNKAEIRRCAIYDCPAWPFRMGRNPHNPLRGKRPFEAAP